MDIYKIIRESKEDYKIDIETVKKLYNGIVEKILYSIINKNENEDYSKISEKILIKKNDYQEALKDNKLEEFTKELNKDFEKVFKKDKKEKIEEFFEFVKNHSNNVINTLSQINNDPNVIIFKLFLGEYENKTAFTWRQFKNVKKEFEKNYPLEGEDIYKLKSLLETDPNITKINNNTLFSKGSFTLCKKTLDKIKKRINGD